MVREDIYQELYLAITELPEDCREIFWLYFQGRNNKEIAKSSLPEKDVRAREWEANYRLKEIRLGGLFFWLQILRIVR